MDEVKKNMNYPDWLGDFKKGDLTEMLKGQAKIWMYFLKYEFVNLIKWCNSKDNLIKILRQYIN